MNKCIKIILPLVMLFCASFVQAQQTPGGVGGSNYQFVAWLTPDGYVRNGNSGTWTNNFAGGNSVGDFTTQTTTRTPDLVTNWGYNFHPSVRFDKTSNGDANNRLRSANAFATNGRNLTVIFVLRYDKTGSWYDNLLTVSTSNSDVSNIVWYSETQNMRWHWNSNRQPTTTALAATQGILTFDNSNGSTLSTWLNGNGGSTGQTRNHQSYNTQMLISANGNGAYGWRGNMQEMIILSSGANGSGIPAADLQKIHSYLAVKYGITLATSLNSGNYVNSNGTVVWDRTVNNGYNNNIFGIARDNISRLNQVQSRSQNTDVLTVFKGTLNALNNNNSNELVDNTYLIVGSNNLAGNNSAFKHLEGTTFDNGYMISDKINFHSSLVYKAQVTANNSSSSETVNMQVALPNVRYVIVSANTGFAVGSTRIYPVTGQVASNVLVNDGDYISFAGFEPTPGGVNMSSYEVDVWIDGDNSTNSSWTNLATANYTLERRSPTAPIVRNSRFNFHKEIYFGNTDRSKLATTVNYATTIGEGYHTFVVSENTQTGAHTLLTFNPTNSDANARRAAMQWNGNNVIRARWQTSTTDSWTNITVSPPNFGVASMSILNTTGANGRLNMNGSPATSFSVTQFNGGNRLVIGNGSQDNSTGAAGNRLPFNGTIQEAIVMRGGNTVMSATDVQQVHSYLAMKYGITLNAGDYLSSDGTAVWTRSANTGFDQNIFGIGRDDQSGLYQKQSRSANFRYLSVYVGNELAILNSQNTGTLADKQYLMIGSDGSAPIKHLTTIHDGDPYENGTVYSSNDFNMQSGVFKAQLTGMPSITVNMDAPANDYLYVLVSKTENFIPTETKIYPVDGRFAEVDLDNIYAFFQFIGFAPGPGGVNPGLAMWLRTDDDAAITINYIQAAGETRLTGYPASDGFTDPDNVPIVLEWQDLIRDHHYTYAAGGGTTSQRYPLFKEYTKEMNYYPAIRQWGSSTSYGSFLGNTTGVLPSTDREHTTILMLNGNFSTNPWSYPFAFGSATNNNNINGPVYGFQKIEGGTNNGNVVGRYRLNNNNTVITGTGNTSLFRAGSTSILNYSIGTNSSTQGNVLFRFNGREDPVRHTYNWDTHNMSAASKIGHAYAYDRTMYGYISEIIIYDRELDLVERNAVESYLALKYGVTLFPSNTTYNRFSYKFSNNSDVWDGDQASGQFVDFYNNVAAIIRDDAARLNNRHAISTNAGSLLHIGVAGTVLSDDGSGLGSLDNMEAVAFGCTDASGFTEIPESEDKCGDFDYRFDRIWLIHKITNGDRPIALLVGAQNNSAITIGDDPAVADYYNVLTPGYDISLIIGDSPANIVAGIYKAVIPMTMINGEFQSSYVFSEEDTYITFGYRMNETGCPAQDKFSGTKTFSWTEWTANTNRAASSTTGLNLVINTPVDLGDNIIATESRVVYGTGVRAARGYPRSVNSPSKGSLQVRRRDGAVESEVTITVTFNNPVIPSFRISGINGPRKNSFEEVQITGECSSATFGPNLSYVSSQNNASYTIKGNKATAKKSGSMSATNKNGMLDVEFRGGVDKVTIKYRIMTRTATGNQNIWITPLTLRSPPSPPPINEDGFSFVKQVKNANITTCEPVEYSFYIQNTNCDDKYMHFTDLLDPAMNWIEGSLVLDSINELYNPLIKVNDYAGTNELLIDSLVIPQSSIIMISASAMLDENAATGNYYNQAVVEYDKIMGGTVILPSVDRETLEEYTQLFAQWQQRLNPVLVTLTTDKHSFKADGEIEITCKMTNPNDEIEQVYMDFFFNDGFTYVPGSLMVAGSINDAARVAPEDPAEPFISIGGGGDSSAGEDDDEEIPRPLTGTNDGTFGGFSLPTGESYIIFKIKAPSLLALKSELEDPNDPIEPLEISCEMFSDTEDTCALEAMSQAHDEKTIPYAEITHIKTNKNKTARIKR